ncbi:prefoldin subunit 4-like protein [Euroglyphus maynei]|uniref:Prefoldin subunit 4 n=1 Tax=Euroglyphus maynei TaxID=6958 RepID=A0A1Y3BR65_EURMA|nr:prefoldin subunit 4-like protein [Euroglyphus maynei]
MILSPASAEAKQQIDVTADDQQMINRFARLNLKSDELQNKYEEFKRQIENLEEAENELMLQDDFNDDDDDDKDSGSDQDPKILKPSSNIQFVVGTSFTAVNKTECESLIEQRKAEIKEKMKNLNDQLAPMKDEMNSIKSKLYAKFGNNINLDSEDS